MGVLLAVTFIAGTFIAIDSSARATLDGILAGNPTDIEFQGQPGNATQMREAVEAIPGIVRAATWRQAQFQDGKIMGRDHCRLARRSSPQNQ